MKKFLEKPAFVVTRELSSLYKSNVLKKANLEVIASQSVKALFRSQRYLEVKGI